MNEMYYFRLFDLYKQEDKWTSLYSLEQKKEYIYNFIEKKKYDKFFWFNHIYKEKMLSVWN
jgi:hypothetical protein